eukprot:155506_1
MNKKWNVVQNINNLNSKNMKGILICNEKYILYFGGWVSMFIFDVETEKIKRKLSYYINLPFDFKDDDLTHAITKNESNILKIDLFLNGFTRKYYGEIQLVPISVLELIYDFMSMEFIYFMSRKGNLCKIESDKLINKALSTPWEKNEQEY